MSALRSQYEGRLSRQERELRELRDQHDRHTEPREEPAEPGPSKVRMHSPMEQHMDMCQRYLVHKLGC